MARSEYRDSINDSVKSVIDDIETNVNDILSITEAINTDSVESMSSGIDEIKTKLQELADKLY